MKGKTQPFLPKSIQHNANQSPDGFFSVELKNLILEFCFDEKVREGGLGLNHVPLKIHMLTF